MKNWEDVLEFLQKKGISCKDLVCLKKEEEKKDESHVLVCILAVIGAIAAIAGIAYAVYRYMTPDYLDDFDDDFDDDFEEDFFDEDDSDQ